MLGRSPLGRAPLGRASYTSIGGTLSITLTGIEDGVHIVSFINVTNPLAPTVLNNHSVAFTNGVGTIDNALLGVSSVTAVLSVQLGSNPKTTGGVSWGVTT
jgi:hypothetical protein